MPRFFEVYPLDVITQNLAVIGTASEVIKSLLEITGPATDIQCAKLDIAVDALTEIIEAQAAGLIREVPKRPEPKDEDEWENSYTPDMPEVLDALDAVSTNTIGQIAKHLGTTPKELRPLLVKGVAAGIIAKEGKGRSTQYFRVVG